MFIIDSVVCVRSGRCHCCEVLVHMVYSQICGHLSGSSDWQTAASLGPTSSHMITGLKPGVTYQFRIVANCHDRILASSPSDPITMSAGECNQLCLVTCFYPNLGELLKGLSSEGCTGSGDVLQFMNKSLPKY